MAPIATFFRQADNTEWHSAPSKVNHTCWISKKSFFGKFYFSQKNFFLYSPFSPHCLLPGVRKALRKLGI